ncbi:hypothetical protein BST61_g3205 [Cercospora zeina]
MAERRSTRIRIPTAKVRKTSKSPTKAIKPPPTPPPTPQTISKPKRILEKPRPKKKTPLIKRSKAVTVSAPPPPPPPPPPSLPVLPTRPPPPPPRPSNYPAAYLWTPLPQTPLPPLLSSSPPSAQRAKLLLQGLKHRHDFHFHALRPAKERVVIYRNSVESFWDELLRLQEVGREVGFHHDFDDDDDDDDDDGGGGAGSSGLERKRRKKKNRELRTLDTRIEELGRKIELAGDKLDDARGVLGVVEGRWREMEGEWYDLLFDEKDEVGGVVVEGFAAVRQEGELAEEDESDLDDEDADIDSILFAMDLPLAFMTQLGACLEHRAFVDELSNQLKATQTKVSQLNRELMAARGEVGVLFPQREPSSAMAKRTRTRYGLRGCSMATTTTTTTTTTEEDAETDEQQKDGKSRLVPIRIARLLGALVSIRRRVQDLEILLSNAEEYGRDLDKELCTRAVMGSEREEETARSPADTIAMLSPSSPYALR